MELITKKSKAVNVVHAWVFAMGQQLEEDCEDFREIYKKLYALGNKATPEAVNEIIGNDSWTDIECSYCGESADKAIKIKLAGDEYELCAKCVKKMQALLK